MTEKKATMKKTAVKKAVATKGKGRGSTYTNAEKTKLLELYKAEKANGMTFKQIKEEHPEIPSVQTMNKWMGGGGDAEKKRSLRRLRSGVHKDVAEMSIDEIMEELKNIDEVKANKIEEMEADKVMFVERWDARKKQLVEGWEKRKKELVEVWEERKKSLDIMLNNIT